MEQDIQVQQEKLRDCYKECRALAAAMDSGGPFFLGDRFSMVDVAFAPFWQRMLWVGSHYIGLKFPAEPAFDRLHKWWNATSKRPSVAATFVCKERLIASYSDYARNTATSDVARTLQKK
jgi:glutathione S-transferase